MREVKQLIREFVIPFLLSSFLTGYAYWENPKSFDSNFFGAIQKFGTSFFLISWLMSQVFRVRKQIKNEDGIKEISDRVKSLIGDLNESVKEIVRQTTGKGAFCLFEISFVVMPDGQYRVQLISTNPCSCPIYDLHLRVFDASKDSKKSTLDRIKEEKRFSINMLPPNMAQCIFTEFWGQSVKNIDLNIFCTSLGGEFNQLLRVRKIDERFYQAIRIFNSDGVAIQEKIDDGYPKNHASEVEW